MSSFLRSAGLTLHGGDIKAMNMKFVPLVIFAVNIVRIWPSTTLAQNLLATVRSNITDHILHFGLFYLLLVWFHLSLGYILSVTATKPGGYPNNAPRSYTAENGAIFRTKSAAENTLESMICFLIAVTICDKLANDDAQELIASWAVLAMLARTVYPGKSFMLSCSFLQLTSLFC